MARNKPVIDVKGLRVERDVTILEDVTWRVERGQHWSILGANGSGKTSLPLLTHRGWKPLPQRSSS